MKIKIIAEASKKHQRMRNIWGLSIIVDEDLIFDTFSDEKILRKKIKKFNIDLSKIKNVVLSHDHWDHIGGLWWLLENTDNPNVYICNTFSESTENKIRRYTDNVIKVERPVEIKKNIFLSGPLKGDPVDEQVMIIKNKKCVVITGCAHPGLIQIIKNINPITDRKIDILLGGFHLYNKTYNEIENITNLLKDKYKVKNIAPFHCTGINACKKIKEIFDDNFISMKEGSIINGV